jgi:uncharacterized membrane protein
MKKLFFVLISSCLVFLTASPVSARELSSDVNDTPVATFEHISTFESEITINKDSTLSIKEGIRYLTPIEKHGIYRYIPIRYKRGNLTYTSDIWVNSVMDEAGHSIPYTQKIESGNLVLKIGDKDKTFTGFQMYVISYTVKNALQRFEDHDELYWDITGEGWQFPIFETLAVVKSPYAVIQKIDCFSGTVGSNDQQCLAKLNSPSEARFAYLYQVDYGKNVTVAVALDPHGGIIFPSPLQRGWETLATNLLLLPIFFPMIFMFFQWYKKGRDSIFLHYNIFDQSNRPTTLTPLWGSEHTPFVYEPLDITPGQAGLIIDGIFDSRDLVAEIVDLARKKYLKIEETKKRSFFKEADYTFTQLKKSGTSLPEHQQYLLDALFATGEKVTLSSLKGKFYVYIDDISSKIMKSLTEEGFFIENPNDQLTKYVTIGVAFLFIDFFITVLISVYFFFEGILPFLAFGIQLVVTGWLVWQMPRKTAKGHNYMLQAKGLRQMITYGKWREKIKEKNLFIEEVLPFAISLGVVDKLTKDMEKLNMKPPKYLSGTYHHNSFSVFTHTFNSQAATMLTYNPSSSSMSSGSGFSGGSSGGGGGGGGGGSW